ncbi:MAG: histidinol dehydrogenase [Rickettsiales bacterium]
MAQFLRSEEAGFAEAFKAFLDARDSVAGDVRDRVESIIARVRKEGDAAVVALTEQFDRVSLQAGQLGLSQEAIANHASQCPMDVYHALDAAAKRIRAFHETQKPEGIRYTDPQGVELGVRWTAMDAVGLYVPGGQASYPSSVLMNAVPAKVAGVKRLVMVVPTPDGEVNAAVMAAAQIAGVDEIYPIGGAQAVAALAYGTESVAPVDAIVGPGNAYVAEAKRQVFGKVGIDMVAGPSEILVVADNRNDPRWIAADLLSQAEHDSVAQSILITDDEGFAKTVMEAVEITLATLPRETIARASWENHGAVIVVPSLEAAAPLVDIFAPEHLELAVEAPEVLADKIAHAGAIFLGRYTPEAVGDYIAGPSHVLPTSRTARFSSALTVSDFMKRSSLIGCTKEALATLSPAAECLANAEGLHAHALSLSIRRDEGK